VLFVFIRKKDQTWVLRFFISFQLQWVPATSSDILATDLSDLDGTLHQVSDYAGNAYVSQNMKEQTEADVRDERVRRPTNAKKLHSNISSATHFLETHLLDAHLLQ
jgi:hypothetical protein